MSSGGCGAGPSTGLKALMWPTAHHLSSPLCPRLLPSAEKAFKPRVSGAALQNDQLLEREKAPPSPPVCGHSGRRPLCRASLGLAEAFCAAQLCFSPCPSCFHHSHPRGRRCEQSPVNLLRTNLHLRVSFPGAQLCH